MIQGKRQEAMKTKEDSDRKAHSIQETLENCKRDLNNEFNQTILEKQNRCNEQLNEIEQEARRNLANVKAEVEEDIHVIASNVERYSGSIHQQIRQKLGI